MNTILQEVNSLQTEINAVLANQNIRLDRHKVNKINELYKLITSGRRLNLGCPECIKIALIYIANWAAENSKEEIKQEVKEEVKVKTTKKIKK